MGRDLELYRTERCSHAALRVAYPPGSGALVLRTELDWDKDVEPASVTVDGISTFQIQACHPFLYFKPCLVQNGKFHWAKGDNQLLIMTEDERRISSSLLLWL